MGLFLENELSVSCMTRFLIMKIGNEPTGLVCGKLVKTYKHIKNVNLWFERSKKYFLLCRIKKIREERVIEK